MKIGIKVGDIMTRNFVAVKPTASLMNCAKEMAKKRVGSLILRDNNKLVGLLTERDIIWALTKKSGKELSKLEAKDIAVKKVTTIKPSADLYDAMQKMRKSKYRWLPVVSKGYVIGMLTLKDILRIEPSLLDTAHEILQIKEETEKFKRRKAATKGETWVREGFCEECGNFDVLYKVDDRLLCEACKEAM